MGKQNPIKEENKKKSLLTRLSGKKPLTLRSLLFLQGYMGFLGLFLGALGLGSAVLLIAVSGWFISAAGVSALSLSTLYAFNYLQPAAMIRLLAMTRTLALYTERIVSHNGILGLLQHLRLWLFDVLSRMERFRMGRFGSGELMQRMIADIDLLDQWPLRGLAPWVWALGLSLVFLAILMRLSSILALVLSLVLFFIFIGLPVLISFPALRLAIVQTKSAGKRRQFFLETLAGIITLRTTGAFEGRLKILDSMDRKLLWNQWLMHGVGVLSQALIFLILSAGLWIMVFYGAEAVQAGFLSPELLVGICCVMLGLMEVMTPLAQTFQALGFTLGARARLRELTEGKKESKGRIMEIYGEPTLCLKGVCARQEGALTGPDGVSFSLKKGESLWIKGFSGSGKSTLAAVMGGWLEPRKGEIMVNSIPMEEIQESCLRRHVGLLDQEVHLFPMGLGDNLRLARPEALDGELWEVLDSAALGDWARQLPDKLATSLGEYGTGLSGGQARRLSLARLLLMATPILILDEPFEGIDESTAEALLSMLRRRQKDGILIVISHQHLRGDFTHGYAL